MPRSSPLTAVALALTLTVSLVPLADAVVASTTIVSAGPLKTVWIGQDLSCQVAHVNDATALEFYPPGSMPGDCGTFLVVGGTLYAPDFGQHTGTATASIGASTRFTFTSQSAVSGAGTASSPFLLTTRVAVGTTGLNLVETDTYVVGNDFYSTTVNLQNTGAGSIGALLYRAADCYLGGSDLGYGVTDATGLVGCTQNPNNAPAGRYEEWIPRSPGSHYMHDSYNTVWARIGTHQPFLDTCKCTTLLDNGAGLSWNLTIPAGATVSVSHDLRFSVPPPPPPAAKCHAEGLRITVRNAPFLPPTTILPFGVSDATSVRTPGGAMAFRPDSPSPPPSANVQKSAVVKYTEDSSAVLVKSSAVFSRCDLADHQLNETTYFEDTYAFAGVENLSITPCGTCAPVMIDVLAGRMEAIGGPNVTEERHRCALAGADTGGLGAETCATVLVDPLSPSLSVNGASVEYGYAPAPVHNADGSWNYERAAFHMTITDTSGRSITIDAGLIALTVGGGTASPGVGAPQCIAKLNPVICE